MGHRKLENKGQGCFQRYDKCVRLKKAINTKSRGRKGNQNNRKKNKPT